MTVRGSRSTSSEQDDLWRGGGSASGRNGLPARLHRTLASTTWYSAGIGGLVLAVVAVGATGLGGSLWTDEAFTATAVGRPFAETVALLEHMDGGSAGYILLMNVWVGLFGGSELALRLPSLAASAVTVVAAASLARRVASSAVGERVVLVRTAGLLAALLVAVHYKLVGYYALEARPYALATAGVTGCALFWQDAARRHRLAPVLLGAGCAAFALTQHVLTAAAVLCLVPWFVRARAGARRRARFSADLAGLGVVLVAGLMGLAIMLTRVDGWLPVPDPWEVAWIASSLLAPSGLVVLVLAVAPSAVVAMRGRSLMRFTQHSLGFLLRGDTLVLVVWAAGPFLLLLAYSLLVEPILLGRYALSSAVALQVLVAVTAVRALHAATSPLRAPAWRRVVAVAAVAMIAVVGFGANLHRAQRPDEELRAAAAHVLVWAQPGDAVVYTPTWREGPFRWYLEERPAADGKAPDLLGAVPNASARSAVSQWTPVQSEIAPAALLAHRQRVWVVGRPGVHDEWGPVPDLGQAVYQELAGSWSRREHVEFTGDVIVELWGRG